MQESLVLFILRIHVNLEKFRFPAQRAGAAPLRIGLRLLARLLRLPLGAQDFAWQLTSCEPRSGAQDLACGSPCATPPPHQPSPFGAAVRRRRVGPPPHRPSPAARPLRLPHRNRHTPAVTATAHKISPVARLVRTPHRISLRHSARLLRLPLKGGVILAF